MPRRKKKKPKKPPAADQTALMRLDREDPIVHLRPAPICPYSLELDEEDWVVIAFLNVRHHWSEALLRSGLPGEAGVHGVTEETALTLCDAFWADVEEERRPLSGLNPDCSLYKRLAKFWETVEKAQGFA